MSLFGISPEKEEALRRRMESLGIFEKDIEETFIRSGGHGGQNVNKVATCVRLKHVPSGVEVKCQQERYQSLNRYLARRILADKIEKILLGKKARKNSGSRRSAARKGNGRNGPRIKMLADKRVQSEKKKGRTFKPRSEDF